MCNDAYDRTREFWLSYQFSRTNDGSGRANNPLELS
jgi:hypothetical protein